MLLKMAVAGVGFSACAAQADFSLGATVAVGEAPYKGYDTKVYPLPYFNYDSDLFYLRGLSAGYYVWKSPKDVISLDLSYSLIRFSPGSTDDHQLKQLDKRRGTMLAGVSYMHREAWGSLRASFAGDVLDNSNGFLGDLGYLYPIKGNNWSVTPGVGVLWSSKNHNKYYFGVSSHESQRSGLSEYTPGDNWNPYIEFTANYKFNANWSTFFTGRMVVLSSEVKDSPMVSRSTTSAVATGVSYKF